MVNFKLSQYIYQGLFSNQFNLILNTNHKDSVIILESSDKVIYLKKKMKSIALAALALSAIATPAFAGPYVETKHEFKGTDEDFSKSVNSARIGVDKKFGSFTPYIEGGAGIISPDGKESETFTVLEVGGKVKLTKSLSAYGKWENLFMEDNTRDWKVELGTKYRF